MNYIELKEKLKEVTKITFSGCLERISKDELCGFGLYTDESVLSLSVSCNINQHLKELQDEEEGYDEYFKWTMGEWKYEMINHKEFSDINDFLEKEFIKAENNQALFLVHRKKIISIAVEVLEELKEENLFAEMNIDFVLMFGISEFDDKDLEKEIVKRLNDKDKYLEFESWINSEE
ncbi:DUF4303 domain-containing protein [Flavobacterium oreochromis]|uniref:DUF4303 domain-containing protein n=2 Tax=Flavobacterium TaxID=237 RepID=A0A246GED6_9FLAO|nr:DUF4303 domain-containing protein [Flavobacterium oreochromis]OWP79041.1 hypothetical protein BWG23_00420 [Flavobacterium oreochromis]OWP79747.1 hypothetical protein BWK62_00480 [Flavobacterium oreochromis]POR30817.1 hypothetical protein BWK58_00530 [Flavobacterium columnare]